MRASAQEDATRLHNPEWLKAIEFWAKIFAWGILVPVVLQPVTLFFVYLFWSDNPSLSHLGNILNRSLAAGLSLRQIFTDLAIFFALQGLAIGIHHLLLLYESVKNR
jgi:hypothetical protein